MNDSMPVSPPWLRPLLPAELEQIGGGETWKDVVAAFAAGYAVGRWLGQKLEQLDELL